MAVDTLDSIEEYSVATEEYTDTADGKKHVNVVEGKIVVTLPDKWNKSGMQLLLSEVLEGEHSGVRGISTLVDRAERYIYHLDLCEGTWEQLEASVRFLSGTRSDSGQPRQRTKTPEKVAYAFYATLNTSALRMQCKLFNLDYDSYEGVDGIIDALVKKQVEMMSVEE